ncbi:hypothetical protein [Microbacterium hominis]|uniref:Dinucleotide-utilizing enzyme n=1 Tax=Microbacterium hominis TaxID=162426 RepID=A0A0B4CSU7_9MICO|nr:hypothetical protein [Microbacterium hominis]KIC57456.1 dinucleotide-utilizing enzyme [Microbacterium hominis]
MPNTARVIRSIPFWVLVGGSLVAVSGGAYLLVDKLTGMADAITAQTATGVDVYPGQIWAVLGAILVGVGLIGLALALTVATLGSFASTPASAAVLDTVEPATATVAAPAVETVSATPVDDEAATSESVARPTV